MKKQKSTALTEEEYLSFFSENITIKRHKELASKIYKRIDFLDDDFFQAEGDFDISCLEKQKPNEVFHCDDHGIVYEGGEYGNICYLLTKFLWDDKYLDSVIAKIEEVHKEEREALRKYEIEIEQVAIALSRLTPAERSLLVDKDSHFLVKAVKKMQDYYLVYG
jgi:hypothetical protein